MAIKKTNRRFEITIKKSNYAKLEREAINNNTTASRIARKYLEDYLESDEYMKQHGKIDIKEND
jgi:hypothetical protein